MKSHYTEYKPCLYTSQDMGRVVCVGDEQMPAPFIFLASWEAEFLRSPPQCGGQLVGSAAHTPGSGAPRSRDAGACLLALAAEPLPLPQGHAADCTRRKPGPQRTLVSKWLATL